MRKLFYESVLPNRNKCINWIGSVGKTVHFIYDDVEGDITIIGYDKNKSIVTYVYHYISYSELNKDELTEMINR